MLNGLFNIGKSALNASQAWISVTGNNIANANTEGYSRQYVDQRDAGGINYNPGEQGLGVKAQQILRYYDSFLVSSYVAQSTNSSRWDEHDTIMATLENLFNESNREGINSLLNEFFTAWQDLSLRPNDVATRESLISFADGLGDMVSNTMDSIRGVQREMDVSIADTVNRINELSIAIADVNKQITARTHEGVSNPNSLLDERDRLVNELATLVDVETIDNGKGEFRVQLTTGQPQEYGYRVYELQVMAPRKENLLMPTS
ncbi:MAG: flagellar hook-associated protein FlgK, partial [Desulfovibrionaceae bacterium]|nr:flagellar hook-associated protein FlgK [Desulfovibrionaceae bacterium]